MLEHYFRFNAIILTELPTLRMTSGVIEDKGRLCGLIKLLGAGGSLSGVISVGIEKSSISLLRMIPVDGDNTPPPKG